MGHYFDEEPGTAVRRRATSNCALPDMSLTLATDRGVFGYGAVDAGTQAAAAEGARSRRPTGDLLDLGCGSGHDRAPDGAARAAAPRSGRSTSTSGPATCAAANADDATTSRNVRVAHPTTCPPTSRFDCIWSNPPIRIGKPALHELLMHVAGTARAGRDAVLVVQKHLGADSLQRWLTEQGYPTERLASSSRLPGAAHSADQRSLSARRVDLDPQTRSLRPGRRRRAPRPSCVPGRGPQQHDVAVPIDASSRGRRGELGGAGTATRRQCGERRQAEQLAAAQLDLRQPDRDRRAAPPAAPRDAAGTSAPAAGRHRARPPTSRAARTSSAIACSPARYRGASSSASRSRKATTSALPGPVQHGLGADQHVARRAAASLSPVTMPTGRPAAASSSSRKPGHAGANQRQRPRTAVLTHHRADRAAASAHQRAGVVLARPPPGSARSAAATGTPAGQQPRPAGGVVHADHALVGIAEVLRSAARSAATASTAPRRCGRPPRRIGQPARSSVDRWSRAPRSCAQCSAVADGHGDTSTHRHAGPPARARSHVAGVPGRRALLLQRLVVLVEHHDRAPVRARRPHRAATADHHVDARRRRAPTRSGMHGRRVARPAQPGRQPTSLVDRWVDDQRRPAAQRLDDHRQRVAGRRQANHAAEASRRRRRRARSIGRRSAARQRARPSPADWPRPGSGRSRLAAQRMRGPRGQVDELGRRADARPLGDRHEPCRARSIRRVGRARRPSRRPGDRAAATRTIDPTATRARSGSGTR